MPFGGAMSNNGKNGKYWIDPSGRGGWFVADDETPETAAANPGNPALGIPQGQQPFSAQYQGDAQDPFGDSPLDEGMNSPADSIAGTVPHRGSGQGPQQQPVTPPTDTLPPYMSPDATASPVRGMMPDQRRDVSLDGGETGRPQTTTPATDNIQNAVALPDLLPNHTLNGGVIRQPQAVPAGPPLPVAPLNPALGGFFPTAPQGAPVAPQQPGAPPAYGGQPLPPASSGNAPGAGIAYDEFDTPEIGGIALPNTPMLNQGVDPALQQYWDDFSTGETDAIGGFYNPQNTPVMQGAQMDLGAVPGYTAREPERNSALDFLLSGQGFDDATMSKMRGRITDDIMRSAAANRGSAKLSAQRAGLQDSGAGLALESQINRQAGDSRNRALNDLDIQNAQQGMQNLTTGAGMELGRSTDAASMANQAALLKAQNVFSGMTQNVANAQQAAGMNTQNQQQTQLAGANAQAGQRSNLGSMFGGSELDRMRQAEQSNVGNEINRGLNQAQLDRQRDMFNTGTQENRRAQGIGAGLSLINSSNPQGYDLGGAQANTGIPNMIPANTLGNVSNQILDIYNQRTKK